MGKQLEALFLEAGKVGGLVGRMRLASLARITSGEASSRPDEPQVVLRVQRALDELRKEQRGDATPPASSHKAVSSRSFREAASSEVPLLRSYLTSYADLISQRALFLSDPTATAQRITEVASSTLGVERASLWACNEERTQIRCTDLFQAKKASHESGLVLEAKDYWSYFRALHEERTIAAHDACSDPRTCCFADSYLKPLGITSMLDVPLWVNASMAGVLCLEHVGEPRFWTEDEETFAHLLSTLASLALELAEGPGRKPAIATKSP